MRNHEISVRRLQEMQLCNNNRENELSFSGGELIRREAFWLHPVITRLCGCISPIPMKHTAFEDE